MTPVNISRDEFKNQQSKNVKPNPPGTAPQQNSKPAPRPAAPPVHRPAQAPRPAAKRGKLATRRILSKKKENDFLGLNFDMMHNSGQLNFDNNQFLSPNANLFSIPNRPIFSDTTVVETMGRRNNEGKTLNPRIMFP